MLKIADIWMRKSNNKISLRKEKEVNTFAAVIKGKQAFIKNESIFSKNSWRSNKFGNCNKMTKILHFLIIPDIPGKEKQEIGTNCKINDE